MSPDDAMVVIVTYQPDLNQVVENICRIRSYNKGMAILIIDNNTTNAFSENVLSALADYYIRFDKNYGIGKAYNKALELSRRLGYSWMLLLDQDTNIVKRFELSKIIEEATMSVRGGKCLISINKKCSIVTQNRSYNSFYEGIDSINSGLIIPTSIDLKFNEALFLDGIDLEFIRKAKRAGYRLLVYKDHVLDHTIGQGPLSLKNPTLALILKVRKALSSRNPTIFIYKKTWRHYLRIRNSVYLFLSGVLTLSEFIFFVFSDLFSLWEQFGLVKAFLITGRAAINGFTRDLEKDNQRHLSSYTQNP